MGFWGEKRGSPSGELGTTSSTLLYGSMNVIFANSIFPSNSQLGDSRGGKRHTDRPKFDIYCHLSELPNIDLDLSLDQSV
jgi:hypothetical protein